MAENLMGLLHTNSNYIHKKQFTNLQNIAIKDNNDRDFANRINRYIKILENKEISFYQSIFNEPIKDYYSFIQKIQQVVYKKDEKVFQRFAAYSTSSGSLYQEIMDWISYTNKDEGDLLYKNIMGDKNQENLQQRLIGENNGVVSAKSIRKKVDLKKVVPKDFKFTLSKKGSINNFKNNSNIGEINIYKILDEQMEGITREQIFPLLVENVFEQMGKMYSKLSTEEKELYVKPTYVWVQTALTAQLKGNLEEQLSLFYGKKDIDFLLDWGFSQNAQRKIYDSSKNEQKQANRILQLLTKLSEGSSQKFKRALTETWKQYFEQFKHFNFGGSTVPGFLGEFAGAILFNYLTEGSKLKTTIVGQQTYQTWGEQLRSDIRVGETLKKSFGIQVKNWQESTLDNFNIDVKLHPIQILSRISMNLTTDTKQEFITYFANMNFNRSFAEYSDDHADMILNFLTKFLMQVGNFYGSGGKEAQGFKSGIEMLDTSPIWLVGGKFLIPGSEILKCFRDATLEETATLKNILKDGNVKGKEATKNLGDGSVSIKHSIPAEGDKEYRETGNFVDYWVKNTFGWQPTDENRNMVSTEFATQSISVYFRFRMGDIIRKTMERIANNGNYSAVDVNLSLFG